LSLHLLHGLSFSLVPSFVAVAICFGICCFAWWKDHVLQMESSHIPKQILT
jgi:hypothetical protein